MLECTLVVSFMLILRRSAKSNKTLLGVCFILLSRWLVGRFMIDDELPFLSITSFSREVDSAICSEFDWLGGNGDGIADLP